MLTTTEVEARLKNWGQYIHQTLRPMPDVMIDRLLKLTYSHITGSPDRPMSSLDGLSLNELGNSMFGRAITVRARFGLANYSCVEIGMLLNIHYVIALAFVERYGVDWAGKMDIKLLKRQRGKHTLFHSPLDEMWHTPETFNFVYATPLKSIIAELGRGKQPTWMRTSDEARKKYHKQRRDAGITAVALDGFGLASNYLRIPLYKEAHIKHADPRKPPTPVSRVH